MNLRIVEQNQVTIDSISLLSCSEFHRVYLVATKEKYPTLGGGCGAETLINLSPDSPSYHERAEMGDTVLEFYGDDIENWRFAAADFGRYTFLAIAYKETDHEDSFVEML